MAVSGLKGFPVETFTGGITDNLFSGDMTSAEEMDNLVVQPDGKLFSRSGSVLDDAVNSPIPIGNQRIGKLINYARNDKLFLQSGKNFYYRPNADQTGSYVDLLGPSGNQALNVQTVNNFVATSEWNKQMFIVSDSFANPMKIYKDQSGAYQLRNIGMPPLANAPTVTPASTGSSSYVYAFIYTYQYQVNGQTFLEEGPSTQVSVSSNGPNNTITNIPVISNGSANNYDTSNIQVQIYRTANNGTNFYLVGTVTNGTTSFTDTIDDTTLQTKPQLYTNDGTLDYNPAPKAKFIHIVSNFGLYGYTNDSDGAHPYRVHQSVVGNPGFVPAITYVELGDEVKGLGSVKGLPIALTKRYIYRLDGTFQSSGAQGLVPVLIHHSAGCLSHESVIEAENYVFWAGNDGFYASDGYQVIKISDHLNQTYQAILRAQANALRIQGKFDEINRRVYWAIQLSPSSLENDCLFVLDLRQGIKPTSTFTTWSGNVFRVSAIEIFNGLLYRGDNNGFVFCHDNQALSDPRVDVASPATSWGKSTIIWDYKSIQMNFGSAFYRKFVTRILLQAENAGNTSIQVVANNDQGKKIRYLKPIRWRKNFAWDDYSIAWGNPDCVWNSQGLIEQWRRFPAGGLRLSYLQVEITNAFSIITTSETDGQLTLNKTNKTAFLSNLWPQASVDYSLYLSNDNYQRGYPVNAINGSTDTLTLLDVSSNLPASGVYDWQLYGYQKDEPLNLIGYTLHWDNVDQSQSTYHSGDLGA